MAHWSLIGDLVSGIPARLDWRDGELSGSKEALEAVAAFVAAGDGIVPLADTGPYVEADLSDPKIALAVALRILLHEELVDGELPAPRQSEPPKRLTLQ